MGKLSNAALRLTAGALILDQGINKLSMDEGSYGYLKGMAANAFPQVNQLSDQQFGKALAASETLLGATLLTPFLPAKLAGAGLTAFSAGLLAMYFNIDGFTKEDGIRPTQDGTAMAKDAVLLGAGLALLFSSKK